MSNVLVKIIDKSLLPAILIIFSKMLGVYLFSSLFGIDISFETVSGNLFKVTPIVDNSINQIQVLSTYSDIFMFAVISVGFIVITIQSLFFHESHINIAMIAKLAEHNLLDWVKSSYELYHTAITWFIFIWLTVIIIMVNSLLHKTEPWVFVVTFVFTISLSVILVRDMIKEIKLLQEDYYGNELY